ncbi:MAG: WD40 repeat domain-containing protein, partial [Ktedonobacterales bacterium]
VGHLVEYEFGRLSPMMNAAVEAHVRSCPICQRQGLDHAATEKRQIEKRIRHLKPARHRMSRRGRILIVLLLLLVLGQLAIIKISQGGLLGKSLGAASPTSSTNSATPTPRALTSGVSLARSSGGSVAFSPDGKSVAGIAQQQSILTVAVWDATTGKLSSTFPWGGTATPGALAWSPDGTLLAAVDGTNIGVWSVSTTQQLWIDNLPTPPAGNMRIYDAQSGNANLSPDPTTTFANGGLIAWNKSGQPPATAVVGKQPVVTAPGGGQISLWETSGSRLYTGGSKGSVMVGASLLNWSPDSRFLLWAAAAEPVSVPSGAAAISSATPGAASGLTPPDAIVSSVVGELAQAGKGDALEWFSPDGKLLAQCDRTGAGASALQIWNLTTGQPVLAVAGVCARLALGSLSWSPSGGFFAVAVPGSPVAVYSTAPGGQ